MIAEAGHDSLDVSWGLGKASEEGATGGCEGCEDWETIVELLKHLVSGEPPLTAVRRDPKRHVPGRLQLAHGRHPPAEQGQAGHVEHDPEQDVAPCDVWCLEESGQAGLAAPRREIDGVAERVYAIELDVSHVLHGVGQDPLTESCPEIAATFNCSLGPGAGAGGVRGMHDGNWQLAARSNPRHSPAFCPPARTTCSETLCTVSPDAHGHHPKPAPCAVIAPGTQ